MQSRGQWGARHFDKVMFTLPIPLFDGKIALHRRLSALGKRAEEAALKLEFSEKTKFQAARRIIRQKLAEAGLTREIEDAVTELFGVPKRPK